jgi:predicted nuclease with TOPRIM domain
MWPFRRRPEPPPERDVGERLDDLEDALTHVNRRFTRLQQQVTRWAREYDDDLEDESEDIEDEMLSEIVLSEIQKRRQA